MHGVIARLCFDYLARTVSTGDSDDRTFQCRVQAFGPCKANAQVPLKKANGSVAMLQDQLTSKRNQRVGKREFDCCLLLTRTFEHLVLLDEKPSALSAGHCSVFR